MAIEISETNHQFEMEKVLQVLYVIYGKFKETFCLEYFHALLHF